MNNLVLEWAKERDLLKPENATKQFMKLVEEGKVDIEKTIGDYLPWVVGNAKAKIRLKDLLIQKFLVIPYFYHLLSLVMYYKIFGGNLCLEYLFVLQGDSNYQETNRMNDFAGSLYRFPLIFFCKEGYSLKIS
jgi:hypothetical protein